MSGSGVSFPNESPEYRAARDRLLELEAELRAKVEEVAAARRGLPLGGQVKEDYVFTGLGVDGSRQPVRLSELFAPGKPSLFLYGFMYGPDMERACPLCSSFLDSLDGAAEHLEQQINVAVVARESIETIQEVARKRAWTSLRLLSSADNSYQRDYLAETEQGHQMPMANVFTLSDGAVYHTWGSELLYHRDGSPGDSRHVDSIWPLWNVLDLTPQGRGETWYPALEYPDV